MLCHRKHAHKPVSFPRSCIKAKKSLTFSQYRRAKSVLKLYREDSRFASRLFTFFFISSPFRYVPQLPRSFNNKRPKNTFTSRRLEIAMSHDLAAYSETANRNEKLSFFSRRVNIAQSKESSGYFFCIAQ